MTNPAANDPYQQFLSGTQEAFLGGLTSADAFEFGNALATEAYQPPDFSSIFGG